MGMSDSASPNSEYVNDYASLHSAHVSEIPTRIPQKRAYKDSGGADKREGLVSDLVYGKFHGGGGLYARPRKSNLATTLTLLLYYHRQGMSFRELRHDPAACAKIVAILLHSMRNLFCPAS